MLSMYVFRRLLLFIPMAIAISAIVFVLVRFAPGDPILNMTGMEYSQEAAARFRRQLGLDQPIPVQYLHWLRRVMRGDLGQALFSRQPVLDLILQRLPTTLALAAASMVVALGISVPLGILSAAKRDTVLDDLSRIASIIGVSMPVFWLGLILILAFAYYVRWFPAGGAIQTFGLKALVLPSVALGTSFAALLTRMIRSSMIEVLEEDYIRTARAKGLRAEAVLYRHAFKNALIPVITVAGLQFGTLLGGAVLTETIFSLPGLGRLLVEAVNRRDYTIIQGCVLFVTFFFMFVNLAVDVVYGMIDPRIRYNT